MFVTILIPGIGESTINNSIAEGTSFQDSHGLRRRADIKHRASKLSRQTQSVVSSVEAFRRVFFSAGPKTPSSSEAW